MTRYLQIGALTLAVVAALACESHAQTTADAGWQDIDLLKGRLVVSAPPGTKVAPNEAANIMAAAPSEEMATKLIVPLGQSENDIVVYVNELFALFPQDPVPHFQENYLGGSLEDRDSPPRSQDLASGLRAYGAFEGQRRHASGNYVLADILVAQPDGTAQEIFIMTWDQPAETLERYGDFASRMIGSLRPGPRQKLATGGQHFIETSLSDGSALRLALDLPKGYLFSERPGPDFTVYRIEKLMPLDTPGGSLGLYVGRHPSMINERRGIPAGEILQRPARIVDQKTMWEEHRKSGANGGSDWIYREAIVPMETDSSGLKMHIFIAAPSAGDEIDRLTEIVETRLRHLQR